MMRAKKCAALPPIPPISAAAQCPIGQALRASPIKRDRRGSAHRRTCITCITATTATTVELAVSATAFVLFVAFQ